MNSSLRRTSIFRKVLHFAEVYSRVYVSIVGVFQRRLSRQKAKAERAAAEAKAKADAVANAPAVWQHSKAEAWNASAYSTFPTYDSGLPP